MPTAANLVSWESDDEPLFGGIAALFKRKAKPCSDSCWLHHGNLLIMDGQCQDGYVHCTDPALEQERN